MLMDPPGAVDSVVSVGTGGPALLFNHQPHIGLSERLSVA
jgi:hypothetical protein